MAVVTVISCKKDQEPESKVDENGLTKEIVNFVPDSIIQLMKGMGMPLYTGDNPPIIAPNSLERKFRINNFTLLTSNIKSESPGKIFSNLIITVKNQDNQNLTIEYYDEVENTTSTSKGSASYIVGQDNMFSIFVKSHNTQPSTNSKADLVIVISGKITDSGIQGLHYANFMLNDYGDPAGVYMEIGNGRVIYDADGMSEFIE